MFLLLAAIAVLFVMFLVMMSTVLITVETEGEKLPEQQGRP